MLALIRELRPDSVTRPSNYECATCGIPDNEAGSGLDQLIQIPLNIAKLTGLGDLPHSLSTCHAAMIGKRQGLLSPSVLEQVFSLLKKTLDIISQGGRNG